MAWKGWKKAGNIGKDVLKGFSRYTPIGGFGAAESVFRHGSADTPAGYAASGLGITTPAAKGAATAQEEKDRISATAMAQAQAMKEEQGTMSAFAKELARLRLKRGLGATILSRKSLMASNLPGAQMLGSGPASLTRSLG